MQSITRQLTAVIDQYTNALHSIPEDKMAHKPAPGKWSKKEILGHLVDSAQNNIRRFIVSQYETEPLIIYNQDQWVAIVNYQHYSTPELIELWRLLNKQIVSILDNASPAMAMRKCLTGNSQTLEWLAQDYIKHLLHHLHQVLELEPVAYP